jgi:DNA-binding NtrC family response regulator
MNRDASIIPAEETVESLASCRTPNILVIECDGQIQELLNRRFSSDMRLDTAQAPDGVPNNIKNTTYDMLIWVADGYRPGEEKLRNIFDLFARKSPRARIIIIAEQEPEPLLCGRKGVTYQYIPQPFDGERLCNLIGVALQKTSGQGTLGHPEVRALAEFEGLIGVSLPMQEVFRSINEASSVDIPVLITGETGTGKELVAAAIHNRSKRRNRPYVPVNTGAIVPELIASELFGHEKGAYTGAIERRQGFFEQADSGTIFLDEISTMDEKTQVGLLRILETKTFRRVRGDKNIHVDVRVIAASNQDLEKAVKNRRFREDLYYRLDVFRIHLPPLRDRPGGVTLLTNHFVIVFNSLYQKSVKVVAPETYRCLRRYSWPGNVRELKNVIQRAVLTAKGEELTLDSIPPRIREATECGVRSATTQFSIHPGMTLEAAEKEFIAMTLAATQGNKREAARELGISRRSLYNKLSKHDLR